MHGTREGVLRALAATGPVITSAGIILAGTFAVLMTLPVTFAFNIGFMVAVGILLDTFIVRTIMVPGGGRAARRPHLVAVDGTRRRPRAARARRARAGAGARARLTAASAALPYPRSGTVAVVALGRRVAAVVCGPVGDRVDAAGAGLVALGPQLEACRRPGPAVDRRRSRRPGASSGSLDVTETSATRRCGSKTTRGGGRVEGTGGSAATGGRAQGDVDRRRDLVAERGR